MVSLLCGMLVSLATPTITFEAFLDIDRVAGGKRFQGTLLYREGKETIVVSYRPVKEYFRFIEKRVIVEGSFRHIDPRAQQVGAPHFDIKSIKLAPGETPHNPVPTTLPPPTAVNDRAAFVKRDGRWVALYATLTRQKAKDGDWPVVELALKDGTSVEATMYVSVFQRSWKPLMGRKVTVISKAKIKGKAPHLVGPSEICKGHLRDCGTPKSGKKKPR